MSLIDAAKSFVNTVVNTTVNTATGAAGTAQEAAQETAQVLNQVVKVVQDGFETAESLTKKIDLGSLVTLRADGTGLSASAQLGVFRVGAFNFGLKGVTVSDDKTTLGVTASRGLGGETTVLGQRVAAYVGAVDGPANMGTVDVQVNDREASGAMVAAAPSPIPELVYLGKARKHDD